MSVSQVKLATDRRAAFLGRGRNQNERKYLSCQGLDMGVRGLAAPGSARGENQKARVRSVAATTAGRRKSEASRD